MPSAAASPVIHWAWIRKLSAGSSRARSLGRRRSEPLLSHAIRIQWSSVAPSIGIEPTQATSSLEGTRGILERLRLAVGGAAGKVEAVEGGHSSLGVLEDAAMP